MPRFFRRLAVGQLDIPDLLVRTDELAGFVTAAAQAYGRDPGKIAALGFSNGANIAVSLLLRHPTLLSAAALLRPMLPYEPEDSLELRRHRRPHRRRRGRPVFLTRADAAAGRGAGRRRGGGHRARGAGRRAQPRARRSARPGAVGGSARRYAHQLKGIRARRPRGTAPAARDGGGGAKRGCRRQRCSCRPPAARSGRTPPPASRAPRGAAPRRSAAAPRRSASPGPRA